MFEKRKTDGVVIEETDDSSEGEEEIDNPQPPIK